ncbi:MAG: AtpZ/AtpI family protein [Parcubacteria group bacterium]
MPRAQSSTSLLRSALQIGVSIVVPLVALLVLGRWLDVRYQTTPLFILIGLILSFIITVAVLVKIVRTAQQQEHKSNGQRNPD